MVFPYSHWLVVSRIILSNLVEMLRLKKKVSSMDAQVLSLEAEVLMLEAEVLSLKAKVLSLKAEMLSLEAEVLSINAQGLSQSALIEALVDEKSKERLQERAIL